MKQQRQKLRPEQRGGGFTCSHCKTWVVINEYIGTANRNHCNWCLWSKHVDIKKGDRRADCRHGMRPVGLTFKHEGLGRVGEVMVVHVCAGCAKISVNRVAGDDDTAVILGLYEAGTDLGEVELREFGAQGVGIMGAEAREELEAQLFGRW